LWVRTRTTRVVRARGRRRFTSCEASGRPERAGDAAHEPRRQPVFAIRAESILAGRYRLERPLAQGGMGSVWVGRHLQLDVPVAVKLMIPEQARSAGARARFEREAKTTAQLKSPNVVHVYDYGREGGTPFMVMELLEGEDLGARLERVGRLSLAAT